MSALLSSSLSPLLSSLLSRLLPLLLLVDDDDSGRMGTTSRNDLKTSQEKNREAMTCKLTAQWYPSFVLQWVICTAACLRSENPTITEMGVTSQIYTQLGATIVCASAEHAENDSYLPLISAFLYFQGGVEK